MHTGFDVRLLSDPEYEQDAQLPSLRKSTKQVIDIVHEEVRVLSGRAERLVIGGISQREATA